MAYEKVMFAIFRDVDQDGRYRVVYFTELDDHAKDNAISSAMRGEAVFDGFLSYQSKDRGKEAVSSVLERLNGGEALGAAEIERQLSAFLVS